MISACDRWQIRQCDWMWESDCGNGSGADNRVKVNGHGYPLSGLPPQRRVHNIRAWPAAVAVNTWSGNVNLYMPWQCCWMHVIVVSCCLLVSWILPLCIWPSWQLVLMMRQWCQHVWSVAVRHYRACSQTPKIGWCISIPLHSSHCCRWSHWLHAPSQKPTFCDIWTHCNGGRRMKWNIHALQTLWGAICQRCVYSICQLPVNDCLVPLVTCTPTAAIVYHHHHTVLGSYMV